MKKFEVNGTDWDYEYGASQFIEIECNDRIDVVENDILKSTILVDNTVKVSFEFYIDSITITK